MSVVAPTTKAAVDKSPVLYNEKLRKLFRSAGSKGGVGSVAAIFFGITSPVSAFIFASTQSVMQQLLSPGVKKYLTDGDNLPSKVYIYVVSFLFSSTVSISMTIALGFPMSMAAAMVLSLMMVPTSYVVDFVYHKVMVNAKRKEIALEPQGNRV